MLSFRKTNEPIPRKLSDRQKNGQKDGHTLFYRTLPSEAKGPKNVPTVKECSTIGINIQNYTNFY